MFIQVYEAYHINEHNEFDWKKSGRPVWINTRYIVALIRDNDRPMTRVYVNKIAGDVYKEILYTDIEPGKLAAFCR